MRLFFYLLRCSLICPLIVAGGIRLFARDFSNVAHEGIVSGFDTVKITGFLNSNQAVSRSCDIFLTLSYSGAVPNDSNSVSLLEKQFQEYGGVSVIDSLAAFVRTGKLEIRSFRVSSSGGGYNAEASSSVMEVKGLTNATSGIPPGFRILDGYSYKMSQRRSWYSSLLYISTFPKLSSKRGFLSFFEQLTLESKLLFFLTMFAFFFLFNITTVTIVVVISNKSINRRKAWYTKQRQYVIEVLSPLLVGEGEIQAGQQDQIENNLRSFTSSREKQVIIDVLLEARRNLTGNAASVLSVLYERLQLSKVSVSSTRSVNLFRRVMGLRELAYLGSKPYSSVLSPFLNSRNPNVRTEAILAYILLDKQSPLGFLDKLHHPFVRWTQLSAYYTMYFNDVRPPILRQYLNHHDPHVVLWCLRLIAIYNQLDTMRDVSRCLTSADPKIRLVAIQTSLSLENWKVKELLKKRYQDEPLPVRLEIIRVISYFAGCEDMPFLKTLVTVGTFQEVREAVRILYNMGENTRKELDDLDHSMSGTLTRFINHVAVAKNNITI